MRVGDLQAALRAVDPSVVVVSPQIMERVIREDRGLKSWFTAVPHWKSWVADRQMLYRYAEQTDLELTAETLLPETVILLARPEPDELSSLESGTLLYRFWRRLFHARVHLALTNKDGADPLTPEQIRERIAEIGTTEFEEAREILVQDGYLPAKAPDNDVYVEFAAVFLELSHFAPSLLRAYFPAILDLDRVSRILDRGVGAAAIFVGTRPRGAEDPSTLSLTRSEESADAYQRHVRAAQRARVNENWVPAAIQHLRAARAAPAARSQPALEAAHEDLRTLTRHLTGALALDGAVADQWLSILTRLLDKADQGNRPAEARLLEDLQQVCLDFEREMQTLDLIPWLRSGGRRPITQALPYQRLVRVVRHLRAAQSRLSVVRLSEGDRKQFNQLLQTALARQEDALRAKFRPLLSATFRDEGLEPTNPPEQASFDKMIEELLDRILTLGFFTFADLRDVISRNQLKIHDLRDPQDFFRGDTLLRLNTRFRSVLAGVYRPGEMYMRLLEQLTSVSFGTGVGRVVTRFVTVPFGGAFVVLHALAFLIVEVFKLFGRRLDDAPLTLAVVRVLQGPFHFGGREAPSLEEGSEVEVAGHGIPLLPAWHFALWGGLGLFLLLLMESQWLRRRCLRLLGYVWLGLRKLFWDIPLEIVPVERMVAIVLGGVFQALLWYGILPVLLTLLLCLRFDALAEGWKAPALTYAVSLFLLNSRPGWLLGQMFWEGLIGLVGLIRAGLFRGLLAGVVALFKYSTDLLEYLLFSIDEWLRFRSGEGQTSLVVRSVLSVIWAPFAYFIRFYMVVLVEPMLNPLKLPISSLAAKFMLPVYAMIPSIVAGTTPYTGWLVAQFFVGPTIWLLPDAFGFLFWEIKENWSLYKANRAANLGPATVGSHGETVKALLLPGFHSGTVPRLYARLRRAEREALRTRNGHKARTVRQELEEVVHAVGRFVSRELVGLLKQSKSWHDVRIEVGPVQVANNHLRVELLHGEDRERPVVLELELACRRWLVAQVRETGWLDRVSPEALRAFTAALAGFYKFAGVDLVREQVEGALPAPAESFAITARGLSVTPLAGAPPVEYDLRDPFLRLIPPSGPGAAGRQPLDPRSVMFGLMLLPWKRWMECWEKDQAGEGNPGLAGLADRLVVLPSGRPGERARLTCSLATRVVS